MTRAESTPVYTSTAEGFRDEKFINSLRRPAEPKPRAPRKAPVKRVASSEIMCFCGERFQLSQAREFMIHLRAEVGEDLATLERWRKGSRESQRRLRREDPGYVARQREYMRKRYAANPERERERQAEYRKDPAFLKRKREYDRKREVLRREARTIADKRCCEGCGTSLAGRRSDARFCSQECRLRDRHAREPIRQGE